MTPEPSETWLAQVREPRAMNNAADAMDRLTIECDMLAVAADDAAKHLRTNGQFGWEAITEARRIAMLRRLTEVYAACELVMTLAGDMRVELRPERCKPVETKPVSETPAAKRGRERRENKRMKGVVETSKEASVG